MATSTQVAIVTGANKGIGYAIVKGLCEKFNGSVYLTARNETKGNEAVKELKDLGYKPLFYQLDVDDQGSVDKFRDYVKNTHGGVDLLINNAAIYYDKSAKVSVQAEENVKTNYFGLLRVCDAFFPLLRENARVVNVSSSAGHLSRLPSAELRAKFSDPELTVSTLNDLMNQFVRSAKDDTLAETGWGEYSYSVSKIGVSALTRVQQSNFDKEKPHRNVSVNSVHPGYVKTDLNQRGVVPIEEGAKAPLYLALGQHTLKGQYVWSDSTVADWIGNPPPRFRQISNVAI